MFIVYLLTLTKHSWAISDQCKKVKSGANTQILKKKKKKNSDSLKGNQHSFTYDSVNLEVPICYLKKQKTPQALYSV